MPVPLGTLTVLVAGREMLSIHPIPDDGRLRVGHDFATLTRGEIAAGDFLGLLRAVAVSRAPAP